MLAISVSFTICRLLIRIPTIVQPSVWPQTVIRVAAVYHKIIEVLSAWPQVSFTSID